MGFTAFLQWMSQGAWAVEGSGFRRRLKGSSQLGLKLPSAALPPQLCAEYLRQESGVLVGGFMAGPLAGYSLPIPCKQGGFRVDRFSGDACLRPSATVH